MDVSNVVVGSHLSISVSGTARLQKQLGANVPDSDLQTTPNETGKQALSKASAATLKAIEDAVKKFSAGASLQGYKDGTSFYNGAGTYLSIIA